MLLNLVEYHWAEHLDDALLLLARLDVKTVPLAGGTYLLGRQDDTISAVVDLRELDLSSIIEDAQGIHIGAMTTLQDIVDAPLLRELAAGLLSSAAQASASSRLIRNSATIGGTLAIGAASQADLLTALVALDAEVVVRSASKTQVNLSAGTAERPGLGLSGVVYKGKQERRISSGSFSTEKRPNELIVEVVVPRLSYSCGASFQRIGRMPTDVALLNTVAMVEIEDGVYRRARLAFGGVNMEPMRVYAVEQQLEGLPALHPGDSRRLLAVLKAGMAEFHPPSDVLVSSGYRRVSGMSLAYQVLEEAIKVSHWRSVMSSRENR
ncbi:MAG TPA: FAD binding domain-containing protein [Ktedonobacteraceae bacterium]|jgi:CO/xanthine dehydrogenase FAD-binding subunit|nr:FAD binding domain-containing protein [Ktedonobacteraceae bacterium]